MKCALELINMRNAAVKAHEDGKENFYNIVVKNSIELCEEIGVKLEDQAKKREYISYSISLAPHRDPYNNEMFCKLKKDGITYSDGTASLCPDTSKYYSLDSIVDYLKSHCLDVVVFKNLYKEYGFGYQSCMTVSVKLPEIN
jgi:hypothetical protein